VPLAVDIDATAVPQNEQLVALNDPKFGLFKMVLS